MTIKPKIFIGSSVESLTIAYAVQQNLTHDAEITVWDQGVFELSQTTIESLISVLDKCDFAIFVFSPDDIVKIKKKQFSAVRDNVVFELGLFIGKLGRARSFIIMPDKPTFHIPTDLLGITAGKYDASRSDGSYQAATGPVSHQIRSQIKKQGLLQKLDSDNISQTETAQEPVNKSLQQTYWVNFFFEKKYVEAIKLIEKEIEVTTDKEKVIKLTFWKSYCEYKVDSRKWKKSVQEKMESDLDSKELYVDTSDILLSENDLDVAISIINKGLEKFNNDNSLIFKKAEYLEKVGKPNEAISLILNSKYEDDEFLIMKLASLYENLDDKKIEEAFSVIHKFYMKDQSLEQLTFRLARLAQQTKRDKLGLYLTDKLTKIQPLNIAYWGYLGNSCSDLQLTNKAMLAYKKAEELSDSKEGWILSNIGNLLNNQGFYSDARKYFDHSLVIEPNSEYSFSRISTIIKLEEEENKKYSQFLKEGLSLIAV